MENGQHTIVLWGLRSMHTHTRKHTQMRLLIFMFLVCVFLFFIWRCYTAHSTQSTHSLLLMLFFTSVIVFGILLLAAAAIFSTLVFLPTFISVLLILFSFSFFVSLVRFVSLFGGLTSPITICVSCVLLFFHCAHHIIRLRWIQLLRASLQWSNCWINYFISLLEISLPAIFLSTALRSSGIVCSLCVFVYFCFSFVLAELKWK